MKRALYLILAMVGLAILGAAGAAFVMSDRDLEDALKSVPGAGAHTDRVVDAKHSLSAGASNWLDDTLYSITSTWRDVVGFSPTNQTPRVVIELEPIRKPLKKREEPMERVEPAPEQAGAAPMKLTPAPPPMPEPEPGKTEAPQPPVPAQVPEPPKPQKMASIAEPPKAPDAAPPAPEPVKQVKKVAKVAEIAKKVEPTPPPPAPKSDGGSVAHKKGLAYYKGVGVTKDFRAAKKLFEEAAEKGHADAQYNLGIMSYLGQGTELDYSRAADWFRMAAEQDHALAQYNLGFLYYGGKGVAKDDLQAFMWIDRAAGLGDAKAIKARDTLAKILPKDIFKKK